VTDEKADTFAERLGAVRAEVAAACGRAGRDPAEVRILAVSKKQPPERVRDAAESGQMVFGENRVQEARAKIPLCPGRLEWHMIGHLQRNKVREAVRLFAMIHAVDSWRLFEALDAAADAAGVTVPVCLEVNVSGEPVKYGAAPDSVPGLLEQAGALMHVDVVGLMTMPPLTPDPADARPYFRALRALRDRLHDTEGYVLPELSMGMSRDYGIAVEEGATWVRLGTELFGR
jgi:PLP dependent protein